MNTRTGEKRANNKLMIWAAALAIALAMFYGLNHFVMGVQGLPLDWDLSPAQQE